MTDTPLSRPQRAAWQIAGLRHAPMLILGGLYLYAAGVKAARMPLWFDEIITYEIAKLDGAGAVIGALLAKADNHPPLDYLVRHYAMAAFGGSELAFRLPSIVAVLVAALCLYVIVLKRTSVVPALAAFSFPFVTVVLEYAYEGRGYGFLMASVCLSLLAWQAACEKPTPARLLFLVLSLSFGPYSHYYGVLNYLPVAAGEAWRTWERRKISWPIVACILASLASLALLAPFVMRATEFSTNFWVKFAPGSLIVTYINLLWWTLPAIAASLVVLGLLSLAPAAEPAAGGSAPVPRHEIAAAVALSLLPFATYVLAVLVTRAFDQRYVLNTVFGMALLFAYLIHGLHLRRPRYAQAVTAIFMLWAAATLVKLPEKGSTKIYSIGRDLLQAIEASPLPVAVPNAHAFLPHRRYLREPLRSRLYYVADLGLAVKYGGSDTSDRMLLNRRTLVQENVMGYCEFTKQHPRFLLLHATKGWLFKKLIADGAQMDILAGSDPRDAVLSVTINRPGGC